MSVPSGSEAAADLMRFLDAAPTPYHAVEEARRRLTAAGFRELDEREEWALRPGDRVFVVRGGGTVCALSLGAAPPSRAGYRLVGAHTDSPNFRLKPRPETRAHGHVQLGVEVYGSPLAYTWLDRDLSIAGRVSLIDGTTRLVRVGRPVCRVSSLAIHLSPTLLTDGLRLNPQTHTAPTLALSDAEGPVLLDLLHRQLAEDAAPLSDGAIAAFDLSLYDTARAALSGAGGELLCSARIDNLASCHAALVALLACPPRDATAGVVLYDHEEVGSQSAAGASSQFLRSVLSRVAAAYPDAGADPAERAFARSLLVSADMAHAVHPNHADKHDGQHAPRLGGGPVLKVNASQSYATDAPGAAVFERACREAGFAAQRFVARNDMRCGSTIGPISAARLSMRTVDVGNPMLSMHSCRETMAAEDVPKMIGALGVILAGDVPSASA